APVSRNRAFQPKPELFWPEIDRLLDLSEEGWRVLIRRTSMKRAKVKGLLRNLMVVVGNSGAREFLPKLERFLRHDDEHVRSHAKWGGTKVSGDGCEGVPSTPCIVGDGTEEREVPSLHHRKEGWPSN